MLLAYSVISNKYI